MEASALRSDLFCSLLNRLGLLPPPSPQQQYQPLTSFYPCIPREWSTKFLYDLAHMLGPIDQQKLNFDLSWLSDESEHKSNLGSLFDHATDGQFYFTQTQMKRTLRTCMISGSLSEMWEPTEECESSASLPGNSSRLLKWIEQQSGIPVIGSPERNVDVLSMMTMMD
jgi:hypothetical protein